MFVGTLSCGGDGTTAPPPPAPPPPPPPVAVATSITVTPETAVFAALGDTTRLTARVLDQNAQVMTGASVTWMSSDATVATVDSSGLVTAAGNGGVSVTATSGQASGTASITVEQVAAGVRVSPSAATLRALGDDLQLSASATDANGHAVPGYKFGWSSSDEAVATVDSAGLVLAHSNGRTHIIAASGAWADSAEITVAQQAADIRLSSPPDTLRMYGDTIRISAVAFDANGHEVPDPPYVWASSDTFVVRVDGSGLATATGNGTADVAASSGLATASVSVTVYDAAGAIAADRAALVALYNATNGPQWTRGGNWLSDQPLSQWSGVSTDSAGRVVELDLRDAGLVGSIPSELMALSRLEVMNLGDNELPGSMPPWLGELTNLTSLDLRRTGLTGRLPPELGNLANLTYLDLGRNSLSGHIPPELGTLD